MSSKKKRSKKKSSKKIQINPKLKILQSECIKFNKEKININVIRDDLLEAGTKQRAIIPYFKQHKSSEFIYVCPFTGGAQVTLGYGAKLTNKKITLFIKKIRPRHPLTKKAMKYNTVNLIEVENGTLKNMGKMAEEYYNEMVEKNGKDYIELIKLGFDNKKYSKIFTDQLKKSIPKSLKDNPPKRLWVPTGSTTLLNCLYKVFPKTFFYVIQTGKTVWPDQIEKRRTKVFITREPFYKKAKFQPPYPTTKSYDAKAWFFVKKFGKEGDYIWNITSDD